MLKTVCILRDDWNIYMIFFLSSSVPCGGTYNATSTPQNASSPHLSNIGRPYSTCTWVIAAPPQQQVQITVWDLQLPSQDCSQSYLELQDSVQVKTPRWWRSHLQILQGMKSCLNQVPSLLESCFLRRRQNLPCCMPPA